MFARVVGWNAKISLFHQAKLFIGFDFRMVEIRK